LSWFGNAERSSRDEGAVALFNLSLSVELGAPSCAKGGLNRDTLLEARHQLLFQRHYAGTRRPFADIRQHGSASRRPSLNFQFG
jgi:hypothetical protein